jgi:hypothetical protein
MLLNDNRTNVQSSWKDRNLRIRNRSEHSKRRSVSGAKMLGIAKTGEQVMKALALTAPSQLSVHFVFQKLTRTIKS